MELATQYMHLQSDRLTCPIRFSPATPPFLIRKKRLSFAEGSAWKRSCNSHGPMRGVAVLAEDFRLRTQHWYKGIGCGQKYSWACCQVGFLLNWGKKYLARWENLPTSKKVAIMSCRNLLDSSVFILNAGGSFMAANSRVFQLNNFFSRKGVLRLRLGQKTFFFVVSEEYLLHSVEMSLLNGIIWLIIRNTGKLWIVGIQEEITRCNLPYDLWFDRQEWRINVAERPDSCCESDLYISWW